MKPTIAAISLIMFSAGLVSQAHAAGPKGKTFGGFAEGKTFTFRVASVVSTRTLDKKKISNFPIPEDIPRFRKGEEVRFKIGRKGKLKGPGFSFLYHSDLQVANTYISRIPDFHRGPNMGIVHKGFRNRPIGVTLKFSSSSLKVIEPPLIHIVFHDVYYILE